MGDNKVQVVLFFLIFSFLVDWIKEKQLLEKLFEGMNFEMIRRSGDILKFMADTGNLDENYIDLIWEASLVYCAIAFLSIL